MNSSDIINITNLIKASHLLGLIKELSVVYAIDTKSDLYNSVIE